jgi:hypothetical protein
VDRLARLEQGTGRVPPHSVLPGCCSVSTLRGRVTVWLLPLAALLVLGTVGCAHRIAFQRIDYNIGSTQHDASIVVVIDDDTLNKTVSIRSFATGIANRWDAQPGMMLKQIADVEFPQMFRDYRVVGADNDPKRDEAALTLLLTVPQYTFDNFHATVTVRAIASGPDRRQLFDKTYTEQGAGQGGKMFGLGAFGMKSAVRQSSFDAYKKIFTALRSDITDSLK